MYFLPTLKAIFFNVIYILFLIVFSPHRYKTKIEIFSVAEYSLGHRSGDELKKLSTDTLINTQKITTDYRRKIFKCMNCIALHHI